MLIVQGISKNYDNTKQNESCLKKQAKYCLCVSDCVILNVQGV